MSRKPRPERKTLVRDARAAAESCIGWNSRLAARRITKFLDDRMAPSGLGLAQFGLMAQIAATNDDTLGALAARLGLDQSTLSRNLRGLEKNGLVEIAIAERDSRRRAVWLTEKGAKLLERAMPLWRAAQTALAKKLDPGLAARFARATDVLEEAD